MGEMSEHDQIEKQTTNKASLLNQTEMHSWSLSPYQVQLLPTIQLL